MTYHARTDQLPELALTGGLVDPRAEEQTLFNQRMTCHDVTDFIANTARFSHLGPKHQSLDGGTTDWSKRTPKPANETRAMIDHVLERARDIRRARQPDQPLSDLVPGLIKSGGLSRSPAFDCLPTVSHWADRAGETSAVDPRAAVRLVSTWEARYLVGEGAKMECPMGAPCWSLKSHGIGSADPGASKFLQDYCADTDTLTTTVYLADRVDTPKTGGVLGAAARASWMRNTRVADAADCASELLEGAATLLAARDRVLATGQPECLGFAEVRQIDMPSWCTARKPLPPKLSGVALAVAQPAVDLLKREGCEGPLLNTSIFAMANGYNRGVYGGSISGLWAIMDSAFVLDYSVGLHSAAMADKLSAAFAEVSVIADDAAAAGPHITDIRIVKGCNYTCLRQKTVIEDAHPIPSRPCIVIWEDLARLARYKLADAVFCHVYYDSGGGEYMAAAAGLGCVVHDWIDLGADVACGEVSNIIPSLTRGSLEEGPLAEVCSRLLGVAIWYKDNDPFNPGALCLLFTHWWQLSNCRHRPIALMGRTDMGMEVAIAATVPAVRPGLGHFRASGTPIERGALPFKKAEARLQTLLNSDTLPETRDVIDLLVSPVIAWMRGADTLPSESVYVGAVLAAQVAYPHGQKILELWELMIVMWECGSMWAAGMAGLCYTHTGMSNCDRARDDLADTTWT